MKKLFAVALLICLLLPCAIAEAPVDVKNLSDDELKALYSSVKEEITNRKLFDVGTLPAGVYQAGVDLPEGKYECTVIGDGGTVEAFRNYESYLEGEAGDEIFWDVLDEGESFVMNLRGDVVYEIGFTSEVRFFTGISIGE